MTSPSRRRRHLLDTNIISDVQRPRPNPLLTAWLEAQAVDGCIVVTCNTRHFEPVRDDIEIFDPTSLMP